MRTSFVTSAISLLLSTTGIFAASEVSILPNGQHHPTVPYSLIREIVTTQFSLDDFREIRAQPIFSSYGKIDHILVYLHSRQFHKVEFASIMLDSSFEIQGVVRDYALINEDYQQQPGYSISGVLTANCPDDSIEFITFAPNNIAIELLSAKDVAIAARVKNLKVKELVLRDATRRNYLDYMSCPKIRGNFYDGDASPSLITTYDGVLNAKEFTSVLNGRFDLRVTNIWLACQAFNNPMKAAIIQDVKARKYAAGINDLEVGPSDEAGACAMKAALDGKPMTAAFWDCYQTLDVSYDRWGFEGNGSDLFWDGATPPPITTTTIVN